MATIYELRTLIERRCSQITKNDSWYLLRVVNNAWIITFISLKTVKIKYSCLEIILNFFKELYVNEYWLYNYSKWDTFFFNILQMHDSTGKLCYKLVVECWRHRIQFEDSIFWTMKDDVISDHDRWQYYVWCFA